MPRPLVLLCNDDGHDARGIGAMARALAPSADVVVCAPEAQQSATSHSLSLHRPLRLREVRAGVFAIDGTPADCVYVALYAGARVLPHRPDLVVSGLNDGPNLGADVFYSGTVAAAREGALRGIAALAASAHRKADFDAASALCARMAIALLDAWDGRGAAPLLNVNVPAGAAWRVVPTRLGRRLYEDTVEFRRDPRGNEYLWIGGENVRNALLQGTDTEAYDRGDATVTPLLQDLTSPDAAGLCARVAEAVASRT